MSRKTIVLADNSYTIRRIVELSFSDETDIELVTFENGLNLKEKLVELRPQIVLVDIKLPEFNGYEVCKFVQETEALKGTKIFLLKGGFEPIDENLLQGLKYENIITKPFDSNALVSNIKKLLEKMPGKTPADAAVEIPSSMPEDEELIEAIPETPRDISFSDVKEEIDSDEILPDEDELIQAPGSFPDDEVLPSEEITRAQPEKDTISPSMEEDDNPFEEDVRRHSPSPTIEAEPSLTEEELNIKRNIEMQEKELQIDPLTLEEINIKRDIERQEREHGLLRQEPKTDMDISDEGEGPEADTADMFPDESKLEQQEPQDDFFSFADKKEKPTESGPSMFEADEKDMFSRQGDQEPEEIPDIKYETDIGRKSILEFEPPPSAVTRLPKAEPQSPETLSAADMEFPEPESLPQIDESPPSEAIQFDNDKDSGEDAVEFATEVTSGIPGVREYEIPDLDIPSPRPPAGSKLKIEEEETLEPEMEIPMAPLTPKAPPQPKHLTKEELAPEDLDFMELPKPRPQPKQMTEDDIAPETMKTITAPQAPKPPKTAPTPTPTPTPKTKQIPTIQQEEILDKIEHNLTHAIKEMLWEIVPPLAEKIIKKEIETLTSEAEKSVK